MGETRRLPIGAELVAGGAAFRVWAPAATKVTLVLEVPEVLLEPDRSASLRVEPPPESGEKHPVDP